MIAKDLFQLYEKVWLMPGRIPVTIIDEGTDQSGERYYTVACETAYFEQQQENPTDGFDWWCTTCDCSPDELMKKTDDQGDDTGKHETCLNG